MSESPTPAWDDACPWPRRLLHVPTMTSYKWMPGAVYGDNAKPTYHAISYTWGRWRLSDEAMSEVDAIEIRGVDWPIPRIDPAHFSREDFHRAITASTGQALVDGASRVGNSKMYEVVDWIWLDVACIDQRPGSLEMASEIGRQAKIFKGASEVFAWLSRHSIKDYQQWQADMDVALSQFTGPEVGNPINEANRPDAEALALLVERFRGDPWFSSLWTLQEAFLCQEAFMLLKDTLTFGEGKDIYGSTRLKDLIGLFETMKNVLVDSPKLRKMGYDTGLIPAVDSFGFAEFYVGFPMNLLAASQHRQVGPNNREDRVYGIMQIFDLQLGKSSPTADPTHHFTLDELEDELGAALLEKYPVMSQMHTHTSRSTPGKAWRLSHASRIPWLCTELYCGAELHSGDDLKVCSVLGTKQLNNILYGTFTGPVAPFRHCLRMIESLKHKTNAYLRIALDASSTLPSEYIAWPWSQRQYELGNLLIDTLPHIVVILLGQYAKRIHFSETRSSALVPEWAVGMLLVPEQASKYQLIWHRIGICIWRLESKYIDLGHVTASDSIPHQDDEQWKKISGYWG